MKFLIDINHPAHVHFFRDPMRLLVERGHQLVVTSRVKEMAVPLLDELGVQHVVLSAHKGGGLLALGQELIRRNWALWQVARRERPDAMAAIGGTFVAHVGWLTGISSLVFYDTENATLQNAITYPFARRVIVPRCYQGRLPSHHERYDGYHELSYLHPNRFQPDRGLAERNGLAPDRDNFFVRTVSWQANHDLLETGWSVSLLRRLVAWLAERGRVHISSETPLPEDLAGYAYRGRVGDVHHLMAHCRLFVGESATMASECAVLGVPAIYAAHTGRGYTDEQESRYGLVSNLRQFDADRLIEGASAMLQQPASVWAERHSRLLDETIDVASYVADRIEQRGTVL